MQWKYILTYYNAYINLGFSQDLFSVECTFKYLLLLLLLII